MFLPDMHTPLFTIITITYNSSQWVRQAIESVLAADFSDFEYLICDDCSTDDTWDIIQLYNDPRIKSFHHKLNKGEYANRNFALENSSGQYLLFVDGDDELYKETLGKLATYINQFPEAGSIWGVSENGFDLSRLPVLLSSKEIYKWMYLANIRIAQIGFAETVFKVELLKELGGFSTKYISGDTHMKKLCALNAPVLLITPGLVYWRISEGQASSTLSNNYNGFRNNVAIDREILQQLEYKNIGVPINIVQQNIRIRNIKLLFSNTFLKGRVKAGIKLFVESGFKLKDLQYLFIKGDYSYYQELKAGKIVHD